MLSSQDEDEFDFNLTPNELKRMHRQEHVDVGLDANTRALVESEDHKRRQSIFLDNLGALERLMVVIDARKKRWLALSLAGCWATKISTNFKIILYLKARALGRMEALLSGETLEEEKAEVGFADVAKIKVALRVLHKAAKWYLFRRLKRRKIRAMRKLKLLCRGR